MWYELQPEGNFCCSVVITHSGFQANVQVKLVFGIVLGPGHFFKAVGFRVDELGVLWDRLVWISVGKKKKRERKEKAVL